MTNFDLTPQETAMMKRAFDQFMSSPVVIAFHAKQAALREIHGLSAGAQLCMPKCDSFTVPEVEVSIPMNGSGLVDVKAPTPGVTQAGS
jgi:hypothetical protein